MIAVPISSRPPADLARATPLRRVEEGSAFAIGVGMIFTLPMVGAFPAAEFVSLGWTAWIFWHRVARRAWPHPLLGSTVFRCLAGSLLVSLGGYIVSDLLRGTAITDLLRGWARLAFLGVDLLAITYLVARDWLRVRWLVAGFVTGVVCSILAVGPHADDYWKFGFAYPLSFLAAMVLPRSRPWLLAATLAGLAVLHLNLGARSLGGICLLAAAMVWLPTLSARRRRWGLLASVALAAIVLRHLYLASGGGERATGSTTERTAMLAFATESFRESPLIGQGSWFTKGRRVEAFFARRAELRDEADRVDFREQDEMVIHSQILAALAEGGILGGAFFIVLGGLLASSLWFAALHDFTLRPLVLVLLLNAGWDLLMSPFSGSERIFLALTCALVVAVRALRRRTFAP